jgi:hypothetical protein
MGTKNIVKNVSWCLQELWPMTGPYFTRTTRGIVFMAMLSGGSSIKPMHTEFLCD